MERESRNHLLATIEEMLKNVRHKWAVGWRAEYAQDLLILQDNVKVMNQRRYELSGYFSIKTLSGELSYQARPTKNLLIEVETVEVIAHAPNPYDEHEQIEVAPYLLVCGGSEEIDQIIQANVVLGREPEPGQATLRPF